MDGEVVMDIPHTTSNYDTKYEYGSVVQYYPKAFSTNKDITMLAIGGHAVRHQQMMGQKVNVAFQDYKLINRHFCDDKCTNKSIGCWRGGYEDPNNCWKCLCPYPFTNNVCSGLPENDYNCPLRHVIASDPMNSLGFYGWRSCYGYIEAQNSNYRVELTITSQNMKRFDVCTRDYSMIEIKYLADKSLMGLCFCGSINKNYTIVSEDRLMVIVYLGYYYGDSARMVYRQVPPKNSVRIKEN
uniref:Astacin domain-containing protein n=1 Tax=Parastrongyloides trichosuri TaxID=131310 RepID=A0A0N4ZLB7_PARTI